jgi:hypothetical protein
MEQLKPSERVLWQGKPLRNPFLMGASEFVTIGIAAIALFIYCAWFYGPNDPLVYLFVFSMGSLCTFIFLFYAPYRLLRGSTDTEYMVTNQRVLFETLSEYAFGEVKNRTGGMTIVTAVDLKDVEEVYLKRGFHDRVFGTKTVYVLYSGFQRTTREMGSEGPVILFHKPPSFPFIKEADEVQTIIQEAAQRAKRNAGLNQELQ